MATTDWTKETTMALTEGVFHPNVAVCNEEMHLLGWNKV